MPYSRQPKQRPLTDEEISAFFHDIAGSDTATHLTFAQLEAKLKEVHQELAPQPKKHHLHHPTRAELEGGNGLHAFLVDLLPDINTSTKEGEHDIDGTFQISKAEFTTEVRGWNVPSTKQKPASAQQEEEEEALEYEKNLPFRRKLAARWSVDGPRYLFMVFVIGLQIGFGLWQGLTYVNNAPVRRALGWGVIVAKFSAGALYPTLFFMLLSMSRWIATLLRRSYTLSRFINADFHQGFHVRMSIVGLLLATLHAIGHLTGTFLYSSRPGQIQALIAADKPVRSYRDYVATLPGWTGIVSLALFWIIALLSTPAVRRWNFEVFQIGHLLLFPMVCFLAAHDTSKLLQGPMLGYWLVFPTIVVLLERLHRLCRSLISIPARIEVLDDETVCITAQHPRNKAWCYSPGQYILLQIPRLSRFQFHPFTISACLDDCLQVHIKTNAGDWTSALRELALEVGPEADIRIGLDGPFGAPAQRFYDYQKSIVVGSGIGITPFVAALSDLERKALQGGINPWKFRSRSGFSRALSCTASIPSQVASRAWSRNSSFSGRSGSSVIPTAVLHDAQEQSKRKSGDELTIVDCGAGYDPLPSLTLGAVRDLSAAERAAQRRVDFIWLVRDKTYLLWFSDLLNRVSEYAIKHGEQRDSAKNEGSSTGSGRASSGPSDSLPIDLRVNTFITAERKNISDQVFRIILDRYRSDTSPVSALTGLRTASHFGRPDLKVILTHFYEDVVRDGYRGNLAVFFCGAPVIGRLLADQCAQLTARSRAAGTGVRFHFLNEVFG